MSLPLKHISPTNRQHCWSVAVGRGTESVPLPRDATACSTGRDSHC